MLDPAHRTGRNLKAPGAERFVIIDSIAEFRVAAAERPEEAPWLAEDAWRGRVDRVRTVAKIATEDCGLTASMHAHTVGCIEFCDEIDRVLEDTDDSFLKLCLDTDHCVYAEHDPVACCRLHRERTSYLHFQGYQCQREGRRHRRTDRLLQCLRPKGCTLGTGMVDVPTLKVALEETGFHSCGAPWSRTAIRGRQPLVEAYARSYALFLKRLGNRRTSSLSADLSSL